jgi:hypothetical protein
MYDVKRNDNSLKKVESLLKWVLKFHQVEQSKKRLQKEFVEPENFTKLRYHLELRNVKKE